MNFEGEQLLNYSKIGQNSTDQQDADEQVNLLSGNDGPEEHKNGNGEELG